MNKKKKTSKCLDCGKPIYSWNKRCAKCNYKNPERNKKISKAHIGENNGNWKGGKHKDGDGYIRVKYRNHHLSSNNGYVKEHRLVAEKKYNRKIKDYEEVVHHLNGIRDDNREKNLVITTKKINGEKTVVNLLQERIRELESKLNNF